MARFLYRVLRAFNFVANFEEQQMRTALRSASLRTLILDDLAKPLSYCLPLTGNAMNPLFNSGIADMNSKADHLIIRRLNGTAQSFLNRVYIDDVVVIKDPNDSRRKYVRKVRALEGALMSRDQSDDFVIPERHCWVVRENGEADAPDSSTFGPLGLDYVIGRVMYAIRTATDHGRVTNSAYAMASDSIVLAQEPVSKHLKEFGKSSG